MRIRLDAPRVHAARVKKGLFQHELAKIAGVNPTSVSLALSTGYCGLKVARGLAKATGLRVQDVIINDAEISK